MSIIPAGFAQVSLLMTGAAVPTGAACTFGVVADPEFTPENVADRVVAALGSAGLVGSLGSGVQVTTTRVKMGPNDTGPSFDRPTAFGSGTHTWGYAGQSALVRKGTAGGARWQRGRMYWPVAESSVDPGGNLTAAYLAAWVTPWNDLLSELLVQEVPMVILHADVEHGAPIVVNTLALQTRAATQRRRQRR